MPTPKKSATTATIDGAADTDSGMPSWDTSDTGRARHLRSLDTWLAAKHPEYATLVEFGLIISKDTVCSHASDRALH